MTTSSPTSTSSTCLLTCLSASDSIARTSSASNHLPSPSASEASCEALPMYLSNRSTLLLLLVGILQTLPREEGTNSHPGREVGP
jgi:hypothetical protein